MPLGQSDRDELGHEWGPHKRGIRWVQCQRCEVVLHEPWAKEPCPGKPGPIEKKRAGDWKQRVLPKFREILRRESNWRS